jgi:hypothetical protein
MTTGNAILLNDLAKMARDGAPDLGAQVTHDPTTLERWAFRDKNGLWPEEAEAPAQRRRQDAFGVTTRDRENTWPTKCW